MLSQRPEHDGPSASQNIRNIKAALSMDDRPEVEEDTVLNDQLQAGDDPVVDGQEPNIVPEFPKLGPRCQDQLRLSNKSGLV